MKSSTRKTMLTGVFACAFATVALGALSLNVASANVAEVDEIAMVDGASLRLEHTVTDENGETQVPFGLRFKTDVNQSWFDGLTAETVEVHTLIVPANLVGEGLTVDNTDAVDVTLDMEKAYEVGDNYRFNTVLTGIPDTQYSRDMMARSYILADDETYYSETTVTRSVVGVASEALVYDSTEYAAIAQYLVKDVTATAEIEIGSEGTLTVSYAVGISEEAKALLDSSLEVTATAGEGNVTYENGKLTAVEAGETTFTVSTLGFSKEITVTAHKGTFGTPILETVTTENIEPYDATTTNVQVLADQTTGKNVIQFTATAPAVAGTKSGVLIDCPDWIQEVADRAYVNVTMEVKTQTSGSNKRGWYVCHDFGYYGQTETRTTVAINGSDDTTWNNATLTGAGVLKQKADTVSLNISNILTEEGKLELTVSTTTASATAGDIQITDIEFRFGKVVYSDSTVAENNGVDLLNHLGLQENEIVSAKFGGEDVTNFTAFKPTQSGALQLTIKKAGYLNECTTTVDVVVYDKLTYTDTVLNFNTILDIYHQNYRLWYTSDNGENWTEITKKDEKRNQAPTQNGTYKVRVQNNVTNTILYGTELYIDVEVQ